MRHHLTSKQQTTLNQQCNKIASEKASNPRKPPSLAPGSNITSIKVSCMTTRAAAAVTSSPLLSPPSVSTSYHCGCGTPHLSSSYNCSQRSCECHRGYSGCRTPLPGSGLRCIHLYRLNVSSAGTREPLPQQTQGGCRSSFQV